MIYTHTFIHVSQYIRNICFICIIHSHICIYHNLWETVMYLLYAFCILSTYLSSVYQLSTTYHLAIMIYLYYIIWSIFLSSVTCLSWSLSNLSVIYQDLSLSYLPIIYPSSIIYLWVVCSARIDCSYNLTFFNMTTSSSFLFCLAWGSSLETISPSLITSLPIIYKKKNTVVFS